MHGNLVKTWKKYETLRLQLALKGEVDLNADRKAYAAFVEGRQRELSKLVSTRKNNRRLTPLKTTAQFQKARAYYAEAAGTIR